VQVTGVGCLGEQGREQSFPAIATGLFTLLVRDLTKSRCPSLACPSAPGYFFLGTFAFPQWNDSQASAAQLDGLAQPLWWLGDVAVTCGT